ncbi:hypothetical protein, partial [Longimicrobium sp.]|uniref:hypothetical protein n=1 Tax=Longimicrobium sp. TaxID=2029185 RepID=UPI002F94D239
MMARSLHDEITSILNREPLPASELYDLLEQKELNRKSIKAAVARLVDRGIIQRGPLRLGHGNTILYVGSPVPAAKLLRKLVDNAFYGRESLVSLIRSLQSSHPAVTRYDIAKIAALEIGRPESPDWEETERTIDGLVSIGVLVRSNSNFVHSVWVG